MVKIKYLFLALVIMAVGIIIFVILSPSEEKRVKKQFQLLSERVSMEPDEKPLVLFQKIKAIGALFDEQCELSDPSQSLSGSYTRDEITAYAGSTRSYFSTINLQFYDFNIVFPEKDSAQVTVTGRLMGTSKDGERSEETRELECILKKIDKEWRFSRIEMVEVLKK